MEGLGVAASVIAVVELSVKISSLCLQYSKDVKHAKDDIVRLRSQVTDLGNASKSWKQLLDDPKGATLKASRQLFVAINDCQSQLQGLDDKLRSRTARQAMSRLGVGSLKWPFQSEEVEKIVQGLRQCMQTVSLALQIDQTSMLLNIDQKMILHRLPIVQGASYDSHAEEHNPTCLPNTRVKLLNQIVDWANDPRAKSIFWLNGMAGTGKSTISRTIAQLFMDKGHLAASFFFKRGEADRGSLSKFFTTIAADLAVKKPATAYHIKNALDTDPSIVNKTVREQSNKLFQQPLSRISTNIKKDDLSVIVIDALDECELDDDIKLIIHLFSGTTDRRLKIFLTSRPDLPLRLGFQAIAGTYQDIVLHEIPTPIIKHDILAFLEHKLAKIRTEYNTSVPEDRQLSIGWPSQSDIQLLAEKAVPLFIFAATVCRFISDRRCGVPDEQLKEVLDFLTNNQSLQLEQLDAIYTPILNKLVIGLSTRNRDKVLQRFQDIIGPIIVLASPLSTSTLAKILSIPRHNIDSKLDMLHSVLSVPPSTTSPVQLLHLSFRDFLVDPEKRAKNPFWIDEKQTHKTMAANCLHVLDCLKQDICNIKAPGTPRSALSFYEISLYLPPEVQYASLYWVYHLQQAGGYLADWEQVYTFLTCHFLHWIEALSLIRKASESISYIKILQSLLKPQSSMQLSNFLEDAMRFVLANISTISSVPLQMYSSLLVFTPEKSKVRAEFKGEIAGWISLEPKVDSDWRQFQQTLEGHSHSVHSVAFSHNSMLMASASVDRTVRIWRADTGECIQTFDGHGDSVHSVAFSHDSMLVASGASDRKVRIWRADTGECTKILEGHSNSVQSVAFSHDSRLVASASLEWTVRIWRADTGKCMQILKGHRSWIECVAFSHDSMLIASAAGDWTVRIWRTDTGECTQILRGHSSYVQSVAFSHDGTIIASAASDMTIRTWRTDTGEFTQTLSGHSDGVYSMASSHDSKTVASVGENTIRIWCTETGECTQVLKCHSDSVAIVAFSHDSTLIASADETTVQIWRTDTGDCTQILEGHGDSDATLAIAFSHDSTLIASAGYGTIRIWRTDTGRCTQILNLNSDVIFSVTFSHDSTLITSTGDEALQIWRTDTGECAQTLEGHGDTVNYVAFSHDSTLIASASFDKTVRIWRADIGECTKILEGHSDSVQSVAFSHDSRLVASASHDKAVRIWRADTGECAQILDIGAVSFHISFEPGTSRLQTDVGIINVCGVVSSHIPTETSSGFRSGVGISQDGCWLTWKDDNLLWLPVEARSSLSAVLGSTVVMGCGSGRVIVIGISPQKIPDPVRGDEV